MSWLPRPAEPIGPDHVMHVSWVCKPCDVGGTDIDEGASITCWNCTGPVTVTARMPRPKAKNT